MRQLEKIRRMRDPIGGTDNIQDRKEEKRTSKRKVTMAIVPIKFFVLFILSKEGKEGTSERTNERTKGRTDGWMDEWTCK